MPKPKPDVARTCSQETGTGGLALFEREVREDTKRIYTKGSAWTRYPSCQVTQMVTTVLDMDHLGHRLNWLSVLMVISNYLGGLR